MSKKLVYKVKMWGFLRRCSRKKDSSYWIVDPIGDFMSLRVIICASEDLDAQLYSYKIVYDCARRKAYNVMYHHGVNGWVKRKWGDLSGVGGLGGIKNAIEEFIADA